MTLSTIAWVTVKLEVSGSGSELTRRSKVGLPQEIAPSGGFFLTTRRRATASSPPVLARALAKDRSLSMTCSGAWTTTRPAVSKPARPARPAIWWNSRTCSSLVFLPSYLDSEVNTTVRIGTLMPTPRVSVPQMTLSRPAWASCSTSRRYLGSMPAWCTPMPCLTSRESVFPKPEANRKSPISSAILSFSWRVHTFVDISAWACSSAAAWVKCTI